MRIKRDLSQQRVLFSVIASLKTLSPTVKLYVVSSSMAGCAAFGAMWAVVQSFSPIIHCEILLQNAEVWWMIHY